MSTSNNNKFDFTINYNGKFILDPLTYEGGSHINIIVPHFDFQDMVTYLNRKLPSVVRSLYYVLPQNDTLNGMKAIKNDYDIAVMYDFAKLAGKIQIFVCDTLEDLTTVLIPDDGCFEESFAGIISEETKRIREERVRYIHQMVQKKKKREERLRFNLERKNKTKPTMPYSQTIFNFIIHNNGQLVCNQGNLQYENGWKMNISIPRMKLDELKQYLSNIVDRKIHALYYEVPHTGFSITVKLRNNYDMHVMFDISAAQGGTLEVFIDHVGVSFSIQKYVCPNATVAKMMAHVITDYTSDNEDGKNRIGQSEYTLDQMVEWAEQEHYENEDAKANERHKALWKNHFYY